MAGGLNKRVFRGRTYLPSNITFLSKEKAEDWTTQSTNPYLKYKVVQHNDYYVVYVHDTRSRR